MESSATPLFLLSRPLLRIDIDVPGQLEWPAKLRDDLNALDSVHTPSQRVEDLGISHHLRRALEYWSRKALDFEREYRSLPFGSKIKFAAVRPI